MKLKHYINGANYIMMDMLLVEEKKKEHAATIEKYEVILHSVKKLKRSTFWRKGFIIMNVLVPERHLLKFSREI